MTSNDRTSSAPQAQDEHPLDAALRMQWLGDDRFLGHTSDAYRNMVGPYGGITAAQMLQAMLQHPQRQGDPIALTVNYAAGVPDGPFEITAVPVRTGGSTQHWSASLASVKSDGTRPISTTAIAVFGTRRDTWEQTVAPMPELPGDDELVPMRSTTNAPWSQRYARRMYNDMDGQQALSLLADTPARPVDFPALAGLCDAFKPWIFVLRRERWAISTVSMNMYFHIAGDELAAVGPGPFVGRSRSNVIHRGFFDQESQLWARDGRLLATTQQTVWFKG